MSYVAIAVLSLLVVAMYWRCYSLNKEANKVGMLEHYLSQEEKENDALRATNERLKENARKMEKLLEKYLPADAAVELFNSLLQAGGFEAGEPSGFNGASSSSD